MALKREMKINIGPDGSFTIEIEGVGGGECVDFSKFLEEELGEVTEREFTEEFYQHNEQGNEITVGGPTTAIPTDS